MKPRIGVLLGCAVLFGVSNTAPADMTLVDTLGFKAITANNVGDVAIAESQLLVEVYDPGIVGQAFFKFKNAGPLASSITDVYFDDGTLLGIASIDNSGGTVAGNGVSFSQFASPGNLPSGNTVGFETTAGFSADSDPPVQPKGVNPGEWLGITFNLKNGGTFADVVDELGDGRLRIGIHVQGFATGGSESLINNGVIPAPGAVVLGAIGLGMVGWLKKRFV